MRTPSVSPSAVIHPSAIVEEGASIGPRTRIWHRSHVRAGSTIGADCTIGFSVYVDDGAVIGNRCKIENHVSVFRGLVLEDEVFVGPSVTFTNDLHPRAMSTRWELTPTVVRWGASLGANTTIVCGVEVGSWSMIAAGAVLTRDAVPHGLFVGSPARHRGWVCTCGRLLGRLGAPLPDHCRACDREVRSMVTMPGDGGSSNGHFPK